VRRFIFLKPSALLVDDLVRRPASPGRIQWGLESGAAPPEITGRRVRLTGPDGELLCETLLPRQVTYKSTRITLTSKETPGSPREEHRTWVVAEDTALPVRFVHLLHLPEAGQKESEAKAKLVEKDDQVELTVSTRDRVFRLVLPLVSEGAGEIEIAKADGATLLGRRLLPSGVLPHGPAGVALLERWDSRYRNGRPGWDTGRPSSELKKTVENGTLRPCRAVELGCGTGTNSIYLASRGFDVTGIDIAPAALNQCIEKAREAEVCVRWMLADVLAPPPLAPFDLIYDRGCYHGVRRQNAAGYVEAVRRLSHPGTRLLILAGDANDPNPRGGPPKVEEKEIRADFSESFEIEWLREIHFDTRNPNGTGALAWSILLRRKGEPR
jgi:SAM-dependent methyltransferase